MNPAKHIRGMGNVITGKTRAISDQERIISRVEIGVYTTELMGQRWLTLRRFHNASELV